jgi:hypothetical protein
MARPDEGRTSGPERDAALTATQAWGDWGSAVFSNLRSWNTEMLHFVGHRMECDGRALEQLSRCAEPGEMARVQQAWISEAADDYVREGRRLAEIASAGIGRGFPRG